MRCALSASALVVLVTAPLAAQKRPLAIEDYYRMTTVVAPTISPDGRWVAFSALTAIEETNGTAVEVWVAATDGASPPKLVRMEIGDAAPPEWTQGGRLRVVAPDTTYWFVDPNDPTEPEATDPPEEVEGVVSPDGRWVARARPVTADPTPAPSMTDFERRHQERFEGDDFDWYPFRRDGQRFPLPDARERPALEVTIEPATGGSASRELTRLGLRVSDLSWSPDGTSILFSADPSIHDELAYARTDLFVVSVDGALSRLTNDGYTYSNAAFSPGGRWISYSRSMGSDMIIDQKLDHGGSRDLFVRPTSGGESTNLTADWDLDPGSPRWDPAGNYLYWTAGVGGAQHLFRVSAAAGAVEQVTSGQRRIQNLTFDRDFRTMSYTVGDFDRPADVWVAAVDGSGERRLTDVHRDFLAEVDVTARPAERVLYSSYDGTPVEGFLLFPRGYSPEGGPYPLIVQNHGGPHAASGYGFNFKNQLFAANGYFVFLPNFRGSTGYGDAFKWGSWGAWGTKDGEDVMAGVDHLIATYPVDSERVGTTGHSYGGIMTNWLITRYPDRFRAAVSGAGASNWTSNYALSDVARSKELEFFGRPWEPRAREIMIRQSAYLNSGGVKAATLFVHGAEDYRVPLEGGIQLYTSLKKQRVPTRMIIYEGMAHGIRGHWNGVHRMINELGWWETYLKPRRDVRAAGGR